MAFQHHNGGSELFAQSMASRSCPSCGETLFAGEAAEFIIGREVCLRWRCSACDHTFRDTESMAEAA